VSVNRGDLILPRVANYPKYLTSAGGEVVDLMSDLGRPLDPWQAWIIERGLGQNKSEDEDSLGELLMAADTCGCWVPRQNGKGDIIMALEVGWLFLFGIPLIGHSAHLYATAAEGFQRIKVLLEENDAILGSAIQHVWAANGKQGIELTPKYNRARLLFTAREGGQGLGFSFPKLIMDEAQALTADLMQTLLPTQGAMWDPQVWFFGTPPRNDTAWIYKIKEMGEGCDPKTAWFDYGIEYIDPNTAEFQQVVGSPEANRLSNPSMGVRRANRTGIRQSTIDSGKKKLGLTLRFAMEYNGMWLPKAREVGDSAIDPQVWARLAASPDVPGDLAIAWHINAKRTHGTIMWAGFVNGAWRIGIADHKPGVDWIIPRLADLNVAYSPVAFAVDARGEAQIEELKAIGIRLPEKDDKGKERPKRGDLIIPGIDGMAQAFAILVDAATAANPRVFHHNEPPLNSAVSVPARPLGGGSTFDHKAGVEVGPSCGAGLAMWAYRERIDKIVDVYDPLANIR
jgi:hypothetical protein